MKDETKSSQLKSCILLNKIKMILENCDYDDATCFRKIEEIIEEYEKFGITITYRHDF